MKRIFPLFVLISISAWAGPSNQDFQELKRIQEDQGRILADTKQELGQLRREVQELKGLIDETRYFFQRESEKNGKLLKDFDFRLTGIEERLSLHQQQLEEILKKPSGKGGASESSEEAEYKMALAEINLNNYKRAITLFEEFLKKYPKSSLADNAQYWKGEAFYALKDFSGALVEFNKVVQSYPKSDKVGAALLKQGFCLFERGAYADAKIFLSEVIQKYPRSDEASEAQERLKKIETLLAAPPQVPPPAR